MTSRQAKIQEDTHFRIMRILQDNPDLTQRELADKLGMSVGGLNYCLNALIDKGFVKMANFSKSKNKFKYVYLLTPQGIAEKVALTSRFLKRKMEEYDALKVEIEALKAEVGTERTLVIVRPTVVFGEQNRGNVYNLLRQIASGKFLMVGHGENRKSMAYVENIAAFIEYSMSFKPGVHIYNFIDKPDFTMNSLVANVNRILGRPEKIGFRLPFAVGYAIGKGFDLVASLTGKRFAISSIRVKKFCANSVYKTAIDQTGFVPPVPLEQALAQTVRYEFVESHEHEGVFYTE